MGRKCIAIKKLYDKNAKNYAYAQRKRGLLKKCIELSILCDQQIYLAIYDKKSQTMVEFQSTEEISIKNLVKLRKSPLKDHQFYQNSDLEALQNNNMTRAEMREIFKFKDGGDFSIDSDMESQPKKIMKMEENLTKPPKKQKKRSSKAASKYGLNESSSTPKTLNSENNKKLWPEVVCVLNDPVATKDTNDLDSQQSPSNKKFSAENSRKVQRASDHQIEQPCFGLSLDLPTPQMVKVSVEVRAPKHSIVLPQIEKTDENLAPKLTVNNDVQNSVLQIRQFVDIADMVLNQTSKTQNKYNGCSPLLNFKLNKPQRYIKQKMD